MSSANPLNPTKDYKLKNNLEKKKKVKECPSSVRKYHLNRLPAVKASEVTEIFKKKKKKKKRNENQKKRKILVF